MGIPDEPFWAPRRARRGVPQTTPPAAAPQARTAWEQAPRRVDDRPGRVGGRVGRHRRPRLGRRPADVRAGRARSPPARRSRRRSTPRSPVLPGLVSGAADLTGNTGTKLDGAERAVDRAPRRPADPLRHPRARHGRRRWSAWPRHGGVLPVGGTFFVFLDYMRPPVRLAVDHRGRRSSSSSPTTRSASARTARRTSRSSSWPRCGPSPACRSSARPTPTRRSQAWRVAVDHDGPTALVLSRQNIAVVHRRFGRRAAAPASCAPSTARPIVLVGTGSEVAVCVDAADAARRAGIARPGRQHADAGTASTRQTDEYQRRVLPAGRARAVGRGRRRRSAGSARPTSRSASTASAPARRATWCSTSSASTSTTSWRVPQRGSSPKQRSNDGSTRSPVRRVRARAPGSTT